MEKETQAGISCPYYSSEFEVLPNYFVMEEGECMEWNDRKANYLIFVLSGAITIRFNRCADCPVEGNELFFLAKHTDYEWRASARAVLLMVGYDGIGFPCTDGKSGQLCKAGECRRFGGRGMVIKKEVGVILEQLVHYLESRLNCHHIFLLKQRELYLMFKHYYSMEEIVQIFYFSLGSDPSFTDRVLDNYPKVKTAKELADLLGYSVKTFEKLFKANFNETPYKWMQERRTAQIRQKLMNRNIPLKQIMYEFNFATSSHFNFYCRRYLGATPMRIRHGDAGHTED